MYNVAFGFIEEIFSLLFLKQPVDQILQSQNQAHVSKSAISISMFVFLSDICWLSKFYRF